jgi:DNA-directed RNA polymerase subunit RPC12/RpoP
MRSLAQPRSSAPAPSQNVQLRIAPAAPDASLAVFDAILTRPRGAVCLPAFSAEVVQQPVFNRTERHARRCPNCGWTDVRRSASHNLADSLLSIFGLVPYRCRTCSRRFHGVRQTSQELFAGASVEWAGNAQVLVRS